MAYVILVIMYLVILEYIKKSIIPIQLIITYEILVNKLFDLCYVKNRRM